MSKTNLLLSTWIVFSILSSSMLSSGAALAGDKAVMDGKVIWDNWYTVSVSKNIPYEYYNEKAVLKDGKIQFFNHVWKKEEGFINEEQLGAFSNGDVDLTPLFYNYRATYRASEATIDGNVHDGKMLVVKMKKGAENIPTVTHSIPAKTFFSIFFPLWLGKQLQTAKPNASFSFNTILEDNIDQGFDTVSGRVQVEKPDEFATKSKTKKVSVMYKEDQHSFWWVDDKGAAVRIEMDSNATVVERTTKEKAEAFLK
jgi:uncharacterized protein YneR